MTFKRGELVQQMTYRESVYCCRRIGDGFVYNHIIKFEEVGVYLGPAGPRPENLKHNDALALFGDRIVLIREEFLTKYVDDLEKFK